MTKLFDRKTAKFEKFMFGCSLNNSSVAKYVDENGVIELRLEVESPYLNGNATQFDSQDDLVTFLDEVCGEDRSNEARSLQRLLARLTDVDFSE